jgi:hypothetical protein
MASSVLAKCWPTNEGACMGTARKVPAGMSVTARDGIARLARQLMAGSIRRAAVACAEELIGGTDDRSPYRL